MASTTLILLISSILISAGTSSRVGATLPSFVGGFRLNTPAYIGSSSSGALLLTQFGILEGGTVTVVDGFASRWPNINGSMPNRTISGFVWPNVLTEAPKGMIATAGDAFFVGDGFLVPGKGNGAVMYFDANSTSSPKSVTTLKSGYFYHVALPFDVDGDGDLDLVTARATLPFLEQGSGELLWLENPSVGGAPVSPSTFPWTEHVIGSGPDFIIALAPTSTPDRLVVVSSEYFNARVTMTTLSRGKLVSYKSVVSGLGNLEGVSFSQLRGDGSWQVIVTNHVDVQAQSGVFILNPPADLSLPWPLTIAAQGMFKTRALFQGASPGFPYGFYPTSRRTGPASIALAGDGTFEAYILTPGPEPLSNYTVQPFIGPYGTIGALLVQDLNRDGFTDIVVPCFDNNEVLGYTFRV